MFDTGITQTALTTTIADNAFPNIGGYRFFNDSTFTASLRALLMSRVEKDSSINYMYSDYYVDSSSPASMSADRMTGYLDNAAQEGVIYHLHFRGDKESTRACVEKIDETYLSVFASEWRRVDTVTDFFRKRLKVVCFINPVLKATCLITEQLNYKQFHYLQTGIPAFVPWYFDNEHPITELEKELLSSMGEKTADHYIGCIAEFAKKYDFRAKQIRDALAGFESSFDRMELERVKQSIQDIICRLDDLQKKYGDLMSGKRDLDLKLIGLESKIANTGESSEIMDYFLSHKGLYLISCTDEALSFAVKDHMSYWDEDVVARTFENERSYVHKNYGRSIPTDDMVMLLKEIFEEQEIKLCTAGAYVFDLRRGTVGARTNFAYETAGITNVLPNTHIDHYRCMGNYVREVEKCLEEHNYIGAIEQCIASAKSLNFSDGVVMEDFMGAMYNNRGKKFLELPDGSVVSVQDAINYLKKEKEAE